MRQPILFFFPFEEKVLDVCSKKIEIEKYINSGGFMRNTILVLMAILILPGLIFGARLENLPTDVTLPNGEVLHLLASGDEFYNKLHDAQGFTIMQSPTDGYYYYAQKAAGTLAPSTYRVGTVNPASVGILPNLNISETEYKAKADRVNSYMKNSSRSPHTGTFNNLCILIRFSDQDEFTAPRSVFEDRFNAITDSSNSLRHYFYNSSYEQLDIITSILPASGPDINVSYQDDHPRNYYCPYNAVTNPIGYDGDSGEREQILLNNAINAVAAQIPADLNLDGDNDGQIDNLCFIIRGPHTAWADLLWAHRWGFFYTQPQINGIYAGSYTLQPENQNDARVLSHEMFHSLGSPDLYHYNFNGLTPTGPWDIMESGAGHMGTYMKYKYGLWIDNIPLISQPGDYTLEPITSSVNNCYRINSSNNSEFFVLEYRKQNADIFESAVPGSGMLIYRINPDCGGNADGPPDEVYIYRQGGTRTVNGSVADAIYSADVYRTEFNDHTSPADFMTYQGFGGLNISQISTAGETISFHYSTTDAIPPVCTISAPSDGAVLPLEALTVHASASQTDGTIQSTSVWLDSTLVFVSGSSTITYVIPTDSLTVGYHQIRMEASNNVGVTASKEIQIRVIDPNEATWFNWSSPLPNYVYWGRGSIPIKCAVDFDLGEMSLKAKKISFYIANDIWGDPMVPGRVHATINSFANGQISETILHDLGDIQADTDSLFEYTLPDNILVTGKIAVVLNLYEYQNIAFDINGTYGHSWITEPDRPWMDALARGALGGAEIQLQLQSPVSESSIEAVHDRNVTLSNYPNPFNPETTVSFSIPNSGDVEVHIYNVKGQLVNTLLREKLNAGQHKIRWSSKNNSNENCTSGIYFCKIKAGNQVKTSKLLLLK